MGDVGRLIGSQVAAGYESWSDRVVIKAVGRESVD